MSDSSNIDIISVFFDAAHSIDSAKLRDELLTKTRDKSVLNDMLLDAKYSGCINQRIWQDYCASRVITFLNNFSKMGDVGKVLALKALYIKLDAMPDKIRSIYIYICCYQHSQYVDMRMVSDYYSSNDFSSFVVNYRNSSSKKTDANILYAIYNHFLSMSTDKSDLLRKMLKNESYAQYIREDIWSIYVESSTEQDFVQDCMVLDENDVMLLGAKILYNFLSSISPKNSKMLKFFPNVKANNPRFLNEYFLLDNRLFYVLCLKNKCDIDEKGINLIYDYLISLSPEDKRILSCIMTKNAHNISNLNNMMLSAYLSSNNEQDFITQCNNIQSTENETDLSALYRTLSSFNDEQIRVLKYAFPMCTDTKCSITHGKYMKGSILVLYFTSNYNILLDDILKNNRKAFIEKYISIITTMERDLTIDMLENIYCYMRSSSENNRITLYQMLRNKPHILKDVNQGVLCAYYFTHNLPSFIKKCKEYDCLTDTVSCPEWYYGLSSLSSQEINVLHNMYALSKQEYISYRILSLKINPNNFASYIVMIRNCNINTVQGEKQELRIISVHDILLCLGKILGNLCVHDTSLNSIFSSKMMVATAAYNIDDMPYADIMNNSIHYVRDLVQSVLIMKHHYENALYIISYHNGSAPVYYKVEQYVTPEKNEKKSTIFCNLSDYLIDFSSIMHDCPDTPPTPLENIDFGAVLKQDVHYLQSHNLCCTTLQGIDKAIFKHSSVIYNTGTGLTIIPDDEALVEKRFAKRPDHLILQVYNTVLTVHDMHQKGRNIRSHYELRINVQELSRCKMVKISQIISCYSYLLNALEGNKIRYLYNSLKESIIFLSTKGVLARYDYHDACKYIEKSSKGKRHTENMLYCEDALHCMIKMVVFTLHHFKRTNIELLLLQFMCKAFLPLMEKERHHLLSSIAKARDKSEFIWYQIDCENQVLLSGLYNEYSLTGCSTMSGYTLKLLLRDMLIVYLLLLRNQSYLKFYNLSPSDSLCMTDKTMAKEEEVNYLGLYTLLQDAQKYIRTMKHLMIYMYSIPELLGGILQDKEGFNLEKSYGNICAKEKEYALLLSHNAHVKSDVKALEELLDKKKALEDLIKIEQALVSKNSVKDSAKIAQDLLSEKPVRAIHIVLSYLSNIAIAQNDWSISMLEEISYVKNGITKRIIYACGYIYKDIYFFDSIKEYIEKWGKCNLEDPVLQEVLFYHKLLFSLCFLIPDDTKCRVLYKGIKNIINQNLSVIYLKLSHEKQKMLLRNEDEDTQKQDDVTEKNHVGNNEITEKEFVCDFRKQIHRMLCDVAKYSESYEKHSAENIDSWLQQWQKEHNIPQSNAPCKTEDVYVQKYTQVTKCKDTSDTPMQIEQGTKSSFTAQEVVHNSIKKTYANNDTSLLSTCSNVCDKSSIVEGIVSDQTDIQSTKLQSNDAIGAQVTLPDKNNLGEDEHEEEDSDLIYKDLVKIDDEYFINAMIKKVPNISKFNAERCFIKYIWHPWKCIYYEMSLNKITEKSKILLSHEENISLLSQMTPSIISELYKYYKTRETSCLSHELFNNDKLREILIYSSSALQNIQHNGISYWHDVWFNSRILVQEWNIASYSYVEVMSYIMSTLQQYNKRFSVKIECIEQLEDIYYTIGRWYSVLKEKGITKREEVTNDILLDLLCLHSNAVVKSGYRAVILKLMHEKYSCAADNAPIEKKYNKIMLQFMQQAVQKIVSNDAAYQMINNDALQVLGCNVMTIFSMICVINDCKAQIIEELMSLVNNRWGKFICDILIFNTESEGKDGNNPLKSFDITFCEKLFELLFKITEKYKIRIKIGMILRTYYACNAIHDDERDMLDDEQDMLFSMNILSLNSNHCTLSEYAVILYDLQKNIRKIVRSRDDYEKYQLLGNDWSKVQYIMYYGYNESSCKKLRNIYYQEVWLTLHENLQKSNSCIYNVLTIIIECIKHDDVLLNGEHFVQIMNLCVDKLIAYGVSEKNICELNKCFDVCLVLKPKLDILSENNSIDQSAIHALMKSVEIFLLNLGDKLQGKPNNIKEDQDSCRIKPSDRAESEIDTKLTTADNDNMPKGQMRVHNQAINTVSGHIPEAPVFDLSTIVPYRK